MAWVVCGSRLKWFLLVGIFGTANKEEEEEDGEKACRKKNVPAKKELGSLSL